VVDIAVEASVALSGSIVDFFNLAKIDGRWWIVNRTFAHTRG
jgi:hypothetical protein